MRAFSLFFMMSDDDRIYFVMLQNGEAAAISRQMSEMGFNDFHISSALQYR
jgi:hypothetical protein